MLVILAFPVLAYNGVLSLENKTYGIFLCGGFQWYVGPAICNISGVTGLDGYEYMSNVYYGPSYTTLHDKVAQLKGQGYTRIVGIGYSAGADAFANEMTRNLDDYYAVALIGLPWFNAPLSTIQNVKTNVVIINGGADTTAPPTVAHEWYLWLPDSITKEFTIIAGMTHVQLQVINDANQPNGIISQFVAGTYPKQEDAFTRYVNGDKVVPNSQVTVVNPTVHFQVQVSSKVAQHFKTTYGFMQVYTMPGWNIIGRLNPDNTGVGYAGDVTLSQGSHKIALGGGYAERPILQLDMTTRTQEASYLAIASFGVLIVVAVIIGVVLVKRWRH